MLGSAQSANECTDARAQQEWDLADSPVYADATELAHVLNDVGLRVECIRRSKEERLFPGKKGAAWFKTDKGVFEVWFLPKPETFDGFAIIVQPQSNGRYIYSFAGTPRTGTPRLLTTTNSAKPISFIRHRSVLFEVWGDQQLAARLQQTFKSP